ncbi:ATP-binding protein [Pedococcus sp.]|uniref:ATP-binding protein n=1 Tax=Pedococcus sp. TaxID=2860345 RepID=UPI002E123539|nr:ATP-binding protein [Pedococcus sp.]
MTIFLPGEPGTDEVLASLFPGDDAAATLARATDWAATSLGEPQTWPEALRTAIRTVMPSQVPMLIWSGPDLVQIYNDAYRPLLGSKHPEAMGQLAADCWGEVWQELGPLTTDVFERGESTYAEQHLLFLERHGYTEETYWTFSYSPIRDASGEVLGVFVATTDVSKPVIESRRLDIVHALAVVSSAELGDADDLCQHVMTIMSGNRHALPFAAVYLQEESSGDLVLSASYGVEPSERAMPVRVRRGSDHPYASVAAHRRERLLTFGPDDDLRAAAGPLGPLLPHSAMVEPLRGGLAAGVAGVVVLGLNPYRQLDDSYTAFMDLITRQVSTLLADARATDYERKRAAALADLDASKTTFFQNVSHEFRTPLTIAMAAARELRELGLDTEQEPHVDAVERAAGRLNRLVDALLEFARAESGTLVPVLEAVDVTAYTAELVSMFRSAMESAGLVLEIDLPEVGAAWLDQEAWAKVVVNLVSNAFKFTDAGTVSVALRRRGDELELTVADTGCGIPVDEQEHVFERFRQVRHEVRPGVPGAGIGLALVADLVRAHGGRVGLESELGRGSTFRVVLPVGAPVGRGSDAPSGRAAATPRTTDELDDARSARARTPRATSNGAAQATVHSATQPSGTPSSGAAAPRLLLVEDHADLRGYLTRLLTSDRWEVTAVADVPSALTVQQPPDLILSDIMLPGQSGLDLVRLVRQDPRLAAVPVILLSARAGSRAAATGLAAGADDYVVKPFEPVELLSRLRVHHELAQQRAQALDEAEARADTLKVALRTSRRIGMAMGILMARHGISSDEAFDRLRRHSANHNIKLRDLAEDVLLTGELGL